MARARIKSTIVGCPRCQGRGRILEPNSQRIDPICGMCAGRGFVSTALCVCGRPVVWLFQDFAFCNDIACRHNVEKLIAERGKLPTEIHAL